MTANKRNKSLIILGAGIMQGPAIKIAKEMGLKTIVADADQNAPCINLADHFEHIDLKDKENIEKLARSLFEKGELAGIMTAGTDFSATVAWVSEKLGLHGIPYEVALNASDKEKMRECFKKFGLPSPNFIIVKEVTDNIEIPFPYPLVVKPVDNMGARGCRKANNLEELKSALLDALRFSRTSRAIVEEYMEGPEFSVDAIVYNGKITICGLADRHIFFPPYFIEMGHTMPTAFDKKTAENLLHVFEKGVQALGITNGAAKGDIKLTPKGPMIGEIAARLSGGYMSGWTYPYSSGVLPTKGAIQVAIGNKPSELEVKRNWVCAERAFISIPGKVDSIQGVEAARISGYVKDVFLRIKAGTDIKFPENNVSKCGNILSAAPDRQTAIESAEENARKILIRLVFPNIKTDEFLALGVSDTERFPPDAFTLTSSLYTALCTLPKSKISNTEKEIGIIPFPEFTASGLKDYVGRTIEETLYAVRLLTGLLLPIKESEENILGGDFWTTLIRGGYQGAVYMIDKIMQKE